MKTVTWQTPQAAQRKAKHGTSILKYTKQHTYLNALGMEETARYWS
jgi:hypothetical protein